MGFNFILYKVVSVLYNFVTRLRQPCHHLASWKQSSHNLVTTMCMVNNIITTLSPSCYNLVTTLFIVHNLVAALSQSCHKVVQPCHFYMGLHVADEALSTYQPPPQSADCWRQKLSATDLWKRDGSARVSKLYMVSSHIKVMILTAIQQLYLAIIIQWSLFTGLHYSLLCHH